jgi:hypothetical protein
VAKNTLAAFENKVIAFFKAGLLTDAQEDILLGSATDLLERIG